MHIQHITTLCEVEISEGVQVKFGCEVKHFAGEGYSSRGCEPSWSIRCTTLARAIEEEARKVFVLLADHPNAEKAILRFMSNSQVN